MTSSPFRVAIVYPGDSETRRSATPHNNRFAALFDAFAAHGIEATPAVYNRAQIDELKDQLQQVDGALVWVNPIDADGHSRDPLDAMLLDVAAAGVFVSAHPDVILKLGTKDVLVDTRDLGWGSDSYRIDSQEALRVDLAARLLGGATRVLKQWRGHSGIGVWRVQASKPETSLGPTSLVRARHAQRGSIELELPLDEFVALMSPYFDGGGHMVDQDWQPRMTDGMVRCYLVVDRVVGFGLQAVNALYPASSGDSASAPVPSARFYHPPDLPHVQDLRQQLERQWIPALKTALDIADDRLPLLWDCDFLPGERSEDGSERYVLCEINVSSVAPFPDSAIEPLVSATAAHLAYARGRRRR